MKYPICKVAWVSQCKICGAYDRDYYIRKTYKGYSGLFKGFGIDKGWCPYVWTRRMD